MTTIRAFDWRMFAAIAILWADGARSDFPQGARRSDPRVHVHFEGMQPQQAPVILGSYLAVPPVLARTDAWAVLPRPYAEALAKDGVVVMLPLPDGFKRSAMTMQMLWPEAQDAAPASKWIRGILVELTSTST
jgi:DNA-binding transcriptional LysR family regulator